MEAAWVAGCSSYETTGVIHLLRGYGISAGLFRPGEQLRTRDTLILCFSSAPLLGWWRYLKITQWVMHRYDIRLIAYSTLFDHGLASKSDQRFAYIRSTGNLTFST